MKKIILINLSVFFLLFCILEFISYLGIRRDAGEYLTDINKLAKKNKTPLYTLRYAPVKVEAEEDNPEEKRPTNIGKKDKPSVLFFGCSYLYGFGNDEKDTIPYMVYKRTGRTTVNRGVCGGCIFDMFKDLTNSYFLEEINNLPKPDYIVYIWILDHFNRISNPYVSPLKLQNEPFYYIKPMWREKDGKLTKYSPSKFILPFYSLFCVKAYYSYLAESFAKEKKEEKMLRFFLMANKICKEKFPQSKFVIIQYKDSSGVLLNDIFIEKLEETGILVLDAEKLAGHELVSSEWRGQDKEHPNGKAFSDVSDGLIKALNL